MVGAPVLIYGANGYTGTLCAERAVELGHRPILAGRNGDRVRSLAERLDLPWRAFDLEDTESLRRGLSDVAAVLHCAGPFSSTSAPMVSACLETQAHYLDITGEIAVFEAVFARDAEARERGVVLLPGVGFDVVPTDCLAARLSELMPDAVELELAFAGGAGFSAGTAKTMAEGVAGDLLVRRAGALVALRHGKLRKTVAFADHPREVTAISWGDVASAFRSTAIPNITCYTRLPRGVGKLAAAAGPAGKLLRGPALDAVQKGIDRTVRGPGAEARARARQHVWGRVANADGEEITGTLEVPEGYTLTARTGVDAAYRVAAGEVEAGATTPSLAFGAGYVEQFDGVEIRLPAP